MKENLLQDDESTIGKFKRVALESNANNAIQGTSGLISEQATHKGACIVSY